MKVGKTLHIDGILSAHGTDATGSSSSGGSGGSVLIEATNMTGHGLISVNGGAGISSATNILSGGGGGGRIGLHLRHQNNYGGRCTAEGGHGYYGAASSASTALPVDGSSGTTYKYESRRGPQYRDIKYSAASNTTVLKPDHTYLKVDAGSRPGYPTDYGLISLPTMVMEYGIDRYEFDEIELHGAVSVIFYHPTVSILV